MRSDLPVIRLAIALMLLALGLAWYEGSFDWPDRPDRCTCDPDNADCEQKVFVPDSGRARIVSCAIWNDGNSSCCIVHLENQP